ncbi:hypothetical protein ABK040_015387 [Willaertia magna]
MLSSFLGTYSGSNNIPPVNNNNANNNNNSLPTVHTQFKCDGCGISPIKGIKYHCCNCNDFDLCEDCYIQNKQQNHYNGTHSFTGIGNSKYNKQSTTTPPTTATTTSTTTNNNNNMNTSRSTNPTPPPVMLNSNNNMNNNNKPAPFVYKFPTPPTNNYNYNNYNNPYVYNHSLANSSSSSSITTMNNNNLLTSSSSSMNNSYHSVQQQQPTFVGTYHPPTPTTLPFSKPLPTTPVTTSTTSFLQPKPIVTPPTSLSSSTTMTTTNSNILTNNTTGSSTTALCKDHHHHHSETCHCCNKEITENSPIYPCVTCIEKLNDEKNYVLCNDCYENYKELQKNNLEDVIHLKEHEFKEFLTLKQFSIWKKTLPSNANGGKKSGKDLQYHELNSLGIEEDTLLCVVCSEKLRNVVYLKCKHIVCCNDCVTQECPICRSKSEYITIIWS